MVVYITMNTARSECGWAFFIRCATATLINKRWRGETVYWTSWIPSYDWSHFNCRHGTQFSVTYTQTYRDIAVPFRMVFALTFTAFKKHCAATVTRLKGQRWPLTFDLWGCQDQYEGEAGENGEDWAVWRESFAHCRGCEEERRMAETMGPIALEWHTSGLQAFLI